MRYGTASAFRDALEQHIAEKIHAYRNLRPSSAREYPLQGSC